MKFYNNEHKMNFLEDISFEYEDLKPFELLFTKSKNYEEKWGKDIYDFNDEETLEYLKSLKITTKGSGINRISLLKKYVSYSSNVSSNNVNGFHDIKSVSDLADKIVLTYTTLYFTREDLLEFINDNKVENREAFVMLAIFEGLQGRSWREIRNAQLNDITEDGGKYYIDLYDNEDRSEKSRTIEISEELYFHAKKTNSIKTEPYIIPKTGELTDRDLADTDYILRGIGREVDQNVAVPVHYLHRMFYDMQEKYSEDRLKAKDIRNSGIGNYLLELSETGTLETDKNGKYIITMNDLDSRFEMGHTTLKLYRIIDNPAFKRKFGEYKIVSK